MLAFLQSIEEMLLETLSASLKGALDGKDKIRSGGGDNGEAL